MANVIINEVDSPILHSRPFSYDAATGIKKTFHYHADGSWTISHTQDQQAMIDSNRDNVNNINTSSWKGEMHKVASIPMLKYMELKQAGILDDPVALKKWLNDRDNLAYRTRLGRV